jgi:hypothetical protein
MVLRSVITYGLFALGAAVMFYVWWRLVNVIHGFRDRLFANWRWRPPGIVPRQSPEKNEDH